MKIALHDAGGKEYLQFMRQLGVEYVVSAVGPGASGALEVDDIVRKKEYFAEHGVIWDVIENLDPRIYYKVMLGEEGREEQMDRVCESIRAVGEAGIGVLQYQWMLLGGLRTEYSPTGRGGARVPRFDMAVAARMPAAAMDWLGGGVYPTVPDRELSASQVWDNLRYFLARAVPVAEECGVKLAGASRRRAGAGVYGGSADSGGLGRFARMRRCGAKSEFGFRLLHGDDRDDGEYGCGASDSALRGVGQNSLRALP